MPTLTAANKATFQQQVRRTGTGGSASWPRRFTVWNGSNISPIHKTIQDLCQATWSLVPVGVWDEIELFMKAGEGGTWQSAFDPHPLAINGWIKLLSHIQAAEQYAVRITPYVVVRGRSEWVGPEQTLINQCVKVADRCNLNVEPGSQYWNGPNDPAYIRAYLSGIGVQASKLETTLIPRQAQVDELGGPACIQAWTDPALVGSASWETYGLSAPGPGPTSLAVSDAIPRLEGWGVPSDPRYQIPIPQRAERDRWAETQWCKAGMQIWWLDGN